MIALLVGCVGAGGGPDGGADTDGGMETAEDSAGDTSVSADPGGPCAAYAPAVEAGTVADPALDELSGLAVSRRNPGVLWTHEDSGGTATLTALDATGATLATLTLDGATNVDWEDLALAPCGATTCLWVGDIGDLGAGRTEFVIYRVEEPLLDAATEYIATPDAFPYTYPDGAEDAEALFVAHEVPYILTKRADATAGLYRLPVGADTLEPLADLPTGAPTEDLTARVTAADLWPASATLLVRTYLHLYTFDLTDPTAPIGPVDVPFALEVQGEAVAWDPLRGGFWQVAEAVSPTLWWTGCAG